MRKLVISIENVLTFLALASTFIMVCLTTADAGGRYFLNRPITGSYEITEKYLMVASVFLAVCYAYREGANVRVTFIVDRLPPRVKLPVNYFAQIFSILYSVFLLVATIPHTLKVIADGLILSILDIPLGPAHMIVPVGLFFMSLRMLLDFWQVKKGKSGLFKELEEKDSTIA
jgi:TRAP-type C4-dicarboxylate transport system permease small subunit